ncbi:hypothetical protein ILYODFUR_030972 [Ilyodon furcidens]|uniref:Uncharacterized protein n=1 Tax=Ilyodon furcidens TaxID=33524 RepID=A0ABV0V9H2_9TELE
MERRITDRRGIQKSSSSMMSSLNKTCWRGATVLCWGTPQHPPPAVKQQLANEKSHSVRSPRAKKKKAA